MHKVTSKYKNPDRYIDRLKNSIDWKDIHLRSLRVENVTLNEKIKDLKENAIGKLASTPNSGFEERITNFNLDKMNIFREGQEVFFRGRTTEITRNIEDQSRNEVVVELTKLYVKE